MNDSTTATGAVADAEGARKLAKLLAGSAQRLRVFQLFVVESPAAMSATEAAAKLKEPRSDIASRVRELAQHHALELVDELPVNGGVKRMFQANVAVAGTRIVQHLLEAAG